MPDHIFLILRTTSSLFVIVCTQCILAHVQDAWSAVVCWQAIHIIVLSPFRKYRKSSSESAWSLLHTTSVSCLRHEVHHVRVDMWRQHGPLGWMLEVWGCSVFVLEWIARGCFFSSLLFSFLSFHFLLVIISPIFFAMKAEQGAPLPEWRLC